MKRLIRLALFVILAVIAYNYFMGSGEEKSDSQRFFKEVGDVFTTGKDILLKEKERIGEGKYDEVVEQIKKTISGLKINGNKDRTREQQQIDRKDILQEIEEIEKWLSEREKGNGDLHREDLEKKLHDLVDRADELVKSVEKE